MKKLTLIFSLLISLNSLAQMSWLDSSNNSSSDKLKTIIKKYPDLNLKIGDAKIISKLEFISPNSEKIIPNSLWVSYDLISRNSYKDMREAMMLEGYRVTTVQNEYTDYNVFGNVANIRTTFGGAQYIAYRRGKSVYVHGGENTELYLLVNATKRPSKKVLRVIVRKIKNGDY